MKSVFEKQILEQGGRSERPAPTSQNGGGMIAQCADSRAEHDASELNVGGASEELAALYAVFRSLQIP